MGSQSPGTTPAGVSVTAVNAAIDQAFDAGLSSNALIKGIYATGGNSAINNVAHAIDGSSSNGANPDPVGLDLTGTPTSGSPSTLLATDIVSLLSAIRGHNPVTIATSGLNLGSHLLNNNPTLSGIAATLSLAGGLQGFSNALKRGDLAQAVLSGGGLAQNALTIYRASLNYQVLNGSINAAELLELSDKITATDKLLGEIGQGLAVLNIMVSIARGDVKGAAISAIALANPMVGAILTVLDMLATDLLGGNQSFEADGGFVTDTSGHIGLAIGDHNGGANVVWDGTMNAMLKQTQQQAAALSGSTGTPMGVIAERLPTISFKRGEMFLNWKDSATGTAYSRSFDLQGNYLVPGFVEDIASNAPWGSNSTNPFVNRNVDPKDANAGHQIASSKDFFSNIAEQYSDAVARSGAIAPQWEVDTINAQRNRGVANAGLNTEQKAAAAGQLLAHDPGDALPGNAGGVTASSQQVFRPVVLDLNGDNTITVTAKSTGKGVLLDVDGDGYAEASDWVGPREGVLVLDRDGDGAIVGGRDMLNDSQIDGAARGLGVLRELDANGDGQITAADPVYAALKVWQDINSDGVVQDSELQTLSALSISSLGVASNSAGSFTQNGQSHLMQTVNLNADAAGVVTALAGNSLLVSYEAGGNELFASAVLDYGLSKDTSPGHTHASADGGLTATDELLDGQEDTTLTISVAQLLDNDKSTSGAASFASLGSSTGGSATYDAAKQTITFTPSANFNSRTGAVASFGYTVTDAQGRQAQATAYIDVASVDDKALVSVQAVQRTAGWRDLATVTGQIGVDSTGVIGYRLPAAYTLHAAASGVQSLSAAFNAAGANVGSVGFANGKMYYASSAGNWQEVWVNADGQGTLTVNDADATGGVQIHLDTAADTHRVARFGDLKLVDNGHGATGSVDYAYQRAAYPTVAARTTYSADGTALQQAAATGPEDAFYVRLTQVVDGQSVDSYEKVVISADTSAGYELNAGRVVIDSSTAGDGQPRAAADRATSPIVLDLNDNGFRFVTAEDSTAFYDLAGDNQRRASDWTTGKDAILAYDANNDGKISGKNEISFTSYLAGATTDLEGLAAFDTNHDGQFSAADAQWTKFRVWQDVNEDGNQTADELSTLAQRGIASIGLASDGVARTVSGVTVNGIGSYTRIDGSQGQLADAQFGYSEETLGSVTDDTVTLTSAHPTAATGGGKDSITGSEVADTINAGTGDDTVSGMGGDDIIYAGAGNDVVDGGAGNDTIVLGLGDDQGAGGDGNDTISGGAGADQLSGGAGNDALDGGDGRDLLLGGDGQDQLVGGAGDDQLYGGAGNDNLNGGTGNDLLDGGAGQDRYTFALGDGNDSVADMGTPTEATRIVLGAGITSQNLKVVQAGDGYVLQTSAKDSITLTGLTPATLASTNVVVVFTDANSTVTQMSGSQLIAAANVAPLLQSPLLKQTLTAGKAFSFSLLPNSFTDANSTVGDVLTLTATLGNNSPLPSWLSFNPATGLFSGTPGNANVGSLDIKVTATDRGGLTAQGGFSLKVNTGYDAQANANFVQPYATRVQSDIAAAIAQGLMVQPIDYPDGQVLGGAGDDLLHGIYPVRPIIILGSDPPFDDHGHATVITQREFNDKFVGERGYLNLIDGKGGNDDLTGSSFSDVLYGAEGNNTLYGATGSDRYLITRRADSDAGHDFILEGDYGYQGGSFSYESWTYGQEWVPSDADTDTVEFGPGIARDQLKFSIKNATNDTQTLAYPGSTYNYLTVSLDGRRLVDIYLNTSGNKKAGVEYLEFQDGTRVTLASVLQSMDVDPSKIDKTQLLDAQAKTAETFRYVVPASAFTWSNDQVQALNVTRANGSALPAWLHADQTLVNGTPVIVLSGTPQRGDAGALDLKVAATSISGATLSDDVKLTVVATNHVPTIAQGLQPITTASVGDAISWVLPANAFSDIDQGDTLTWRYTPDDAVLSSWLTFNPATRTLSGTVGSVAAGKLVSGVITVTDSQGASASLEVDIAVLRSGDTIAPTLTTSSPADEAVALGKSDNIVLTFSEAIKAGTGSLRIVNSAKATDTRTIAVTDSSQVTISGNTLTINPMADLLTGANYSVQMVPGVVLDLADNAYAGIANATTLNFATVPNQAPTLGTPLTAQTTNEASAWQFTVPAGTFADADATDVLSYAATLADGSALPSWLSFDAATRSFTGTPPHTNAGTLALKVTATDAGGVSVSSTFDLQVKDTVVPALASSTPADDATAVVKSANLVLTFSEAIKAGTGNLLIVNTANSADTRTIAATDTSQVTISGNTLTINPTADLLAGASYSVQLASGVVLDTAGNAYAGISSATTLNFATASAVTYPSNALVGTPGVDNLTATDAFPIVYGLDGNDTLTGGTRTSTLIGGAGNDTLSTTGGPDNVLDGGDGDDTLSGGWGSGTFIGGEGNNTILVNGDSSTITAGAGNDHITGGFGNDTIRAGDGDNWINGGSGHDAIFAGSGNDVISADWGEDVVIAGDGNNTVTNTSGDNLVVTGSGVDSITLQDVGNIIASGAGDDHITSSAWGWDWISGGKGNDLIEVNGGNKLIAFNRGDGQDVLKIEAWSDDTLSLGGGIRYADLQFSKSGNDLVLKFGQGDQINLTDWYTNGQPGSRRISKLQVLTQGGDYVAGSSSSLTSKTVTAFDFTALAEAFDTVVAGNAGAASGWTVATSYLTTAQLYTVPAGSTADPWVALQAGTDLVTAANAVTANLISTVPTAASTQAEQLLYGVLHAAPTLVWASPGDDATGVAVGADIVLAFSEGIKAGTGNVVIVNTANAADTRTIAIGDTSQIDLDGNTLAINPSANLLPGATYSVQMAAGVVKDRTGNSFAGISSVATLNFSTVAGTYPANALVGTSGADNLTATDSFPIVYGLDGDDTLTGGTHTSTLIGGAGNDTLTTTGGPDNVLDGGDGDDTLSGGWGSGTFIGGEGNNTILVNGDSSTITAGAGNDHITGGYANDVIRAGDGDNWIYGGGGDDAIYAGSGNDIISGDWGEDLMVAGNGDNTVTNTSGENVIVTGSGIDSITIQGAGNLIASGAGDDHITSAAWGLDWISGGKGNDLIEINGGNKLIAFNRGDGQDVVKIEAWSDNTLSLGGGIRYTDLQFSKSGNDLVLKFSQGDQINLKDWYTNGQAGSHRISRLQVLTEGGSQGGDYVSGSSSSLTNKKLTVFDFTAMADAFDTAVAANASAASGWTVSSGALASTQLYASDVPPVNYVNPWVALQAGIDLVTQTNAIASNPIITTGTTAAEQLLFAALNTSPASNAARGWMQ